MLSNPLVVEAAETLFVPACVYNNTLGDADARVREAFEEPAWNNPVVRFVRHDRTDLVPRVVNRWDLGSMLWEMTNALRAHGRVVPAWLRTVADEERARTRGVETAIFGMG